MHLVDFLIFWRSIPDVAEDLKSIFMAVMIVQPRDVSA